MMTRTIGVTLVLFMLAACEGERVAPDEKSQSFELSDDTSRKIVIVEDRLGFEHMLRVRASKTSLPRDLHDRDTVMNGYRIHAAVVTTEDAYLYAAFCSERALAVYPSRNGLLARAGVPTRLPSGEGEMEIYGEPGAEVLYLILSRNELSIADARLAAALECASKQATDCGSGLDSQLSMPGIPERTPASGASPKNDGSLSVQQVMRGDVVKKQPRPPRTADSQSMSSVERLHQQALGSVRYDEQAAITPLDSGADQSDEPDFIRKVGDLVWYEGEEPNGPKEAVAADTNGIAIVRYEFRHVASTSR
jgi:hypothetical protein